MRLCATRSACGPSCVRGSAGKREHGGHRFAIGCGRRYHESDTTPWGDRAMNKAVTIGVAILVVVSGLGMLHAANPDEKGVVVEDRPLRSWLEEQFKERSKGGDKAEAVLRRFCADPKKAIPALSAALEDKEEIVRIGAAECLGYYCKTDVESVLPPLLKALREDKSSDVRAHVATALGAAGLENKVVLAALLKALKEDKAGDVRAKVVCKV